MKDINIDNNEKKKKITTSIIFGVILLVLVGVTYAYFFIQRNINLEQVKSGTLALTFTNGTDELMLNNAIPIYEDEIEEKSAYTTFSIKNTGTLDMYTEIYFKDMTIPNALKSADFKWSLEQSDTSDFSSATQINSGDFSDASSLNNKFLAQELINPNSIKYYRIRIWIEETGLDQSALNGVSFSGKIGATGYVRPIRINPNPPELAEGMIPVTYNESTESWIKADVSGEWYNYDEQKWANAVTVSSTNRDTYMSAAAGTTISMEDINTMWVWIPRFKYRIPDSMGKYLIIKNPPEIDVIFESGTSTTGVTESTYRNGITTDGTNTNYYTHPAFRDGSKVYNETPYDVGGWDKELTGIWVSKFESGTDNENCNAPEDKEECRDINLIIKPDVLSLYKQNVSTQFLTSLKLAGGVMDTSTGKVTFKGNNIYGLTGNTDTHMSKNTEWGAVSILSQSKYGKMGNSDYKGANKEIYTNNSSLYTGRSGGAPGGSTPINGTYPDQTSKDNYNSTGYYTYNDYLLNYNTNTKGTKVKGKGIGASTTGTIYGIYDMSGGKYDITMANYYGYSGWENSYFWNSGFNGKFTDNTIKTDGINFPENKYYDKYTKGELFLGDVYSGIIEDQIILGDTTWETSNWYKDISYSLTSSRPFPARGGTYNLGSIFSFTGIAGGPDSNSHNTFRVTLIL